MMAMPGNDKMGKNSDVNDSDGLASGSTHSPEKASSQSAVQMVKVQLFALWGLLGLNLPTVLMMLKSVSQQTPKLGVPKLT